METFSRSSLQNGHSQHRVTLPEISKMAHGFSEHKVLSGQQSGVPLRHRSLPASFWQEPNRPVLPNMVDMFPLHFDPLFHRSLMEQMCDYKLFLEKLHNLSHIGLMGPSSRYPITEFLYHNYGMKNKTTSPDVPATLPRGLLGYSSSCFNGLNSSTVIPYLHRNYLDNVKLNSQISLRLPCEPIICGSGTLVKPIATKSFSKILSSTSSQRYHPFLGSK